MPELNRLLQESYPWLLPLAASAAAALVWVIVVALVYHAVRRGLDALEVSGRLPRLPNRPLQRTARLAALITASLLVLQQFGLLRDAWTTLSALLAMVAIGFVAVWSVLSNTLCALIIMIARPFRVGDTIELVPDNLRGRIIDFSLLFTTLEHESGEWIQVPNNLFFQRAIRRCRGTSTVSLEEQLQSDRPAQDG